MLSFGIMGPLLLSRPVRARLSACQVQRRSHEHLSAFSCKRRGFCPSCGAYRIVESAVHLVDPCGDLGSSDSLAAQLRCAPFNSDSRYRLKPSEHLSILIRAGVQF